MVECSRVKYSQIEPCYSVVESSIESSIVM